MHRYVYVYAICVLSVGRSIFVSLSLPQYLTYTTCSVYVFCLMTCQEYRTPASVGEEEKGALTTGMNVQFEVGNSLMAPVGHLKKLQ